MANTFKFGNGNWAVKEGKVLAYNDENNNFKPLPFDFTRASTATRVNKAGLIESVASDVPRIDYLNDANGALLLEPSRTNLLSYSDDLDSWGKTNVGVTSNSIISPDGTQNADTITVTTETTVEAVASGFSADGSSNYTISGYIKKSSTSVSVALKIRDALGSGTTHCLVIFNTLNANVTASIGTYSITSFNDDWWYVTATSTTPPTAGVIKGIIRLTNEIVGTEVVAWGLQVEAGSYATSYIPTNGSTVTRVVDAALQNIPTSVINSTEGVFYFEGSALFDDGTNRYISLNDGTTSNYIYFRYVSTSNQYLFRTQVGGVTVNTLSAYLSDTTENHKFALKFKSGDYALWVDGVEISTDTSSTIFSPNTLSKIEYSFPTDGGDGFLGKTKDFRIYNTALSDAELIALTS